MTVKAANLSRKERDDKRKRQEILDAAMSIFAEQGFHGTTMAKISQVSQYPLGTIYKYFSSKKQIYSELVMEKVHDLGGIFLEISRKEGISPCQKLRESLFAMADFYKKNDEFIRIYISERSSIDAVVIQGLNRDVNRMHHKMVLLFQNIFEQGLETGEFRPYPAQAMATLFSDIAHSASWSSLFMDESEDGFKKRLDMVFEMFIHGVVIGIDN